MPLVADQDTCSRIHQSKFLADDLLVQVGFRTATSAASAGANWTHAVQLHGNAHRRIPWVKAIFIGGTCHDEVCSDRFHDAYFCSAGIMPAEQKYCLLYTSDAA